MAQKRTAAGRLRAVRTFFYMRWCTLCVGAACAAAVAFVPQISHVFALPAPDFTGRSEAREVLSALFLWCVVLVLPAVYAWALARGIFRDAAPAGAAPPGGAARRPRFRERLRALPEAPARFGGRLSPAAAGIAGGACALVGLALCLRLLSLGALLDTASGLSPSRNIGCGLAVLGAWLLARGVTNGHAWRVAGRALSFLFAFGAIGEVLWLLAQIDAPVMGSFHACTIWAIYQMVFIALVFALWIDGWQIRSRFPVRAAAVFAVLCLALAFGPKRIGRQESAAAPSDWVARLSERLDAIPRAGPFVFVAASGGGSRAALFTALVYEALASDPIEVPGAPEKYNAADHIALVSSVSGGSLATAYYAHRVATLGAAPGGKIPWAQDLPRLRSSLRGHLAALIAEEAERLAFAFGDAPEKDAARAALEECRVSPAAPSGAPWLLASRFADDMCTDFMAPLLRALLVPGSARGVAVERFWKRRFEWPDAAGRTPRAPLVLYNSCEVETGLQVVMGEPPLPAGFFARGDTPRAAAAAALADYNPCLALAPSEAVRASANFPWGFEIAAIDRAKTGAEERRDSGASALLIDGGVLDNTGMATLRHVLEALDARAGGAGDREDAAAARSVLGRLRERGVILIEIDSGAKRTPPGRAARVLSSVLGPVQALGNAAYVNADFATWQHIEAMKAVLAQRIRGVPVSRLYPLCLQCNHEENVMTAWALGSRDKAKVMVRFLTEIAVARATLADILRCARELRAENLARSDADGIAEKVARAAAFEEEVGRAGAIRRLRDRGAQIPKELLERPFTQIEPRAKGFDPRRLRVAE